MYLDLFVFDPIDVGQWWSACRGGSWDGPSQAAVEVAQVQRYFAKFEAVVSGMTG